MKLDERADTKSNCRARFKRQEGSVVKKVVPINCKPWMLKKKSITCTERTSTSAALESTTAPLPGDDTDEGGSSEAEFSSDSD